MKRLNEELESRQVPIYFSALLLGALTGLLAPATDFFDGAVQPALILMLFATFVHVPLGRIGQTMRSARFIGALLITNFLVLPLISAGLLQLLPAQAMLRFAVLFVLLAPCIDYVISFTHLA